MPETVRPTVLVVDDDDTFRDRLVRAFEQRGYEAWGASDGQQGVERAARESPEFAVVDLKMAGMGGLELVEGLRRIDETTRIVVLTGYGSIATAVEAVKLGATHYLSKPSDLPNPGVTSNANERIPKIHPSPIWRAWRCNIRKCNLNKVYGNSFQ